MTQQIGRYQLIRWVGKGGMGAVYEANDPHFVARRVAVKVLRPELTNNATFRARFEREANMLADLEHPAIVPIYDFGEDQNQLYLVMRYMPGGSLRQRLPLPLGEVSRILMRLADGLDKVHQRGFIHRDIKPDNVLFDEDGKAYLTDFGIAREIVTATVTAIGTPRYMAPEQLNGRKIDARTDVYQLGLMLFEMLTGQLPTAGHPIAVERYNPQLPASCNQVIARAIAPQKEHRYQSAGELARAFMHKMREGDRRKRRPSRKSSRRRKLKQFLRLASIPLVALMMLIIWAIYLLVNPTTAIGSPLATILSFVPEITVERADDSATQAEFGLPLYLDDLVLAHAGTSATFSIYCEAQTETLLVQLNANQGVRIDCDEVLESGLVVGRIGQGSQPIQVGLPESPSKSRSSRGSPTPLLLTPRNTVIAEGHPTFEWEAVPNASGYRLELTIPNAEDWEAETTETRLSYPAELPPLPAGSTVFVELATLERPTSVDHSFIDLLDEESLTEVQAEERAIHDLSVDQTTKAYLLAQLYRQQGMKSAAITQIELITANEEHISADLWQQLGDLYFELERHQHAENAYQQALDAAKANSNPQAQAKATIGLALTAHAFDETEQAQAYLEQAETLAREVGAEELVEKVVALREQMGR